MGVAKTDGAWLMRRSCAAARVCSASGRDRVVGRAARMAGSKEAAIDVATRAAGLNVLLQVLLRVSTFILNGVVLRYVDAHLLGVVNLRLTLLYDTVLFLSREALRKAGLTRSSAYTEWTHTSNLMWCCVPVGVILSAVLGVLWLSPAIVQPDTEHDTLGVFLFCLSALVELAVEPAWVLAQVKHYVTLKVLAEALAHVARCLVVVVGVTTATDSGLLTFCAGQLTFSVSYALIYYGYFALHISHSHPHSLPIHTISHILPSLASDKKWFTMDALHLSWSFFKQSFLKQFLTNGERYVMTVFGVLTFAQQGVYDIIHNLGSMIPRFIFLPIEESFYVYFARVLYRGEPAARQREGVVDLAAHTLSMLLKLVLHVGLTILCFGYAYSFLALDIYGGSLLSNDEGPTLLRWYSAYVLTLAVNGVTECFTFAAMSQRQVDSYNKMMLVFSVVFLVAALVLTRLLGSVGFILANIINMTTRIAHSCHFIGNFFQGTAHSPLTSSLPSLPTCLTFTTAFIITATSEYLFCCDKGWSYRLTHIAIGAATLAAMATVIITTERELFQFLSERLPTRVQGLLERLRVVRKKTE